jgi:acyl-CoA synthetase (AMP-forming)/AMP-acid ligase II
MGLASARRYKGSERMRVSFIRSQIMKSVVAALLAVTLAGCVVVPARPYYGGYYGGYYGHPCCYRY